MAASIRGNTVPIVCCMYVFSIFGEYCQNGIKYDHLTIANLPYRPLYYSPGSKHLEPDLKCSDLIETMPVGLAI